MSGALVGVDLGGTNIRAAVATGPTSHGPQAERRTPAADGPAAVVAAIAESVREVAPGPLAGLAIGIPGPLNPGTGVVFATPHLTGWENVNARDLLQTELGCPVAIHNDANLAGYAEWVCGAGKDSRHCVFVTVSTGVGGALIIDGTLYSGAAGTAAEIGHMPVDDDGPACGQGHRGCLEGRVSGTAIARRAREALAAGERSALSELQAADLDASHIAAAARAGDALSRRLYEEAGRGLGRALGGLINLLSPDVIVIGGGLIHAGELLFDPVRQAVGEIAFAVPAAHCRIVPAGLGTDAGIVGACAWAVRMFPPA